jgi:hypothetical protein
MRWFVIKTPPGPSRSIRVNVSRSSASTAVTPRSGRERAGRLEQQHARGERGGPRPPRARDAARDPIEQGQGEQEESPIHT